jgi:hypothetical protein
MSDGQARSEAKGKPQNASQAVSAAMVSGLQGNGESMAMPRVPRPPLVGAEKPIAT